MAIDLKALEARVSWLRDGRELALSRRTNREINFTRKRGPIVKPFVTTYILPYDGIRYQAMYLSKGYSRTMHLDGIHYESDPSLLGLVQHLSLSLVHDPFRGLFQRHLDPVQQILHVHGTLHVPFAND